MELGILPEKLLLAKFRTTRPLKQSGIDPVNRLFERSRTLKISLPISHRKEAENLLLERNKVDVVSDEKCGNGPSNWLKLKSMLRRLAYFDEKSGNNPLILL
jgi:hypothetical protein